MNVLVIDQSDCTRSIVRGLLVALGIASVAEAATGDEALAIAARFQPDLILADESSTCSNNSPERGASFVTAFRERDTTTPIVVLTAGTERVLSHAGVSTHLVKPFNHAELAAAINAVSRSARAG